MLNKADLLLSEGESYRNGKGRTERGEEGKGMQGTPVSVFEFSLE